MSELKIISDRDVRFEVSENAKIIRLAEIEESKQTALDLQARQHEHEKPMAQKVLDDRKGVGDQIESIHEEVKTQVVRQGVNRIMSHFFNSGKPPTAQSTFYYPNVGIRISWFLFISILTYRGFVWIYFLFLFRGKK
jgi:hypothetical protein